MVKAQTCCHKTLEYGLNVIKSLSFFSCFEYNRCRNIRFNGCAFNAAEQQEWAQAHLLHLEHL